MRTEDRILELEASLSAASNALATYEDAYARSLDRLTIARDEAQRLEKARDAAQSEELGILKDLAVARKQIAEEGR